jgi:hypothetical protein
MNIFFIIYAVAQAPPFDRASRIGMFASVVSLPHSVLIITRCRIARGFAAVGEGRVKSVSKRKALGAMLSIG